MRWYITAAITSTKTIKILSNIHSIEAAQCFSLNLNLQAPSPLAGLFVCPGRGRAGGYPAPAWTGPRPARVESPFNPLTVPKGEIREVVKTDVNGLKVRHFIGQDSFVKFMGRPGRRVVSFRTDQGYVDASGRGLR